MKVMVQGDRTLGPQASRGEIDREEIEVAKTLGPQPSALREFLLRLTRSHAMLTTRPVQLA